MDKKNKFERGSPSLLIHTHATVVFLWQIELATGLSSACCKGRGLLHALKASVVFQGSRWQCEAIHLQQELALRSLNAGLTH